MNSDGSAIDPLAFVWPDKYLVHNKDLCVFVENGFWKNDRCGDKKHVICQKGPKSCGPEGVQISIPISKKF